MHSVEDINRMVISALSETLGRELSPKLPRSTDLYKTLYIDSMDTANLFMILEDDFDVVVDEKRFFSLTTLGEVVDLLHELETK